MEKILEPIYGVKLDFLIVDQTGKVVDGDYIRYDVQKCMRTTLYSANVEDLKRVRDRKLNRDQILLDLPPLCFRDVNGNDIEFDSNPKTMMLFAQIISSFNKEFDKNKETVLDKVAIGFKDGLIIELLQEDDTYVVRRKANGDDLFSSIKIDDKDKAFAFFKDLTRMERAEYLKVCF